MCFMSLDLVHLLSRPRHFTCIGNASGYDVKVSHKKLSKQFYTLYMRDASIPKRENIEDGNTP